MDAVQQEVRHIVSLLMKRPITEEIAMEVKSIEGYRHLEIENGEWIGLDHERDEMTTGEQHGWIETLILTAFTNYALLNKAGRVYPGDVTFVLDGEPDDIRKTREPDVAFVLKENIAPTQGFIYKAPDLAVEIISPSQTYPAMIEKVREYFQFGTKRVWLVLPNQKQIEVHTPDNRVTKYGVGDTIMDNDLLPGFSLDVASIFES